MTCRDNVTHYIFNVFTDILKENVQIYSNEICSWL